VQSERSFVAQDELFLVPPIVRRVPGQGMGVGMINTHCRIGKIKKRHNLKVVEIGDHKDSLDATWRWPVLEILEMENVQDVMVIVTQKHDKGKSIHFRCNSAKADTQIGMLERAKNLVARKEFG